jgi:hypothetical protein
MMAKNVAGESLIVRASLSERMMAPNVVEGLSIARADRVSVRHVRVPSTLRPGICYSIQLDTCIQYSSISRVRPSGASGLTRIQFRYQKFYGTDQISESLRVGDEHIGSDGRAFSGFTLQKTRQEARPKKALMTMWKWLLFCRIRQDRRRATVIMPTNFRDYACSSSRIHYLIVNRSAIRTHIPSKSRVTHSCDWEMKVPLECCNASRTLICEKDVQRRLH